MNMNFVLGCDAVKCGKTLPTFWEILLPPTSEGDTVTHRRRHRSPCQRLDLRFSQRWRWRIQSLLTFRKKRTASIFRDYEQAKPTGRAAFSVAACFLLVGYLTFRYWWWTRNIVPKLHCVIYQQIMLFVVTAVMTSIPTYHKQASDTPWKTTQCHKLYSTIGNQF